MGTTSAGAKRAASQVAADLVNKREVLSKGLAMMAHDTVCALLDT